MMNWKDVDPEEDNTFPEEGVEVLVSDGINYDVAWYLRSGSYKWVKSNLVHDDLDDFRSFIPIKWLTIE